MRKIYSEKKSSLRAPEPKLLPNTPGSEKQLPNFRLTQRDEAILLAVYRYRVLTTPQIERLFFSNGSGHQHGQKPNTRCQYRLQLLYHYGYLRREEQPQRLSEGRKPLLYTLSVRGAKVIAELLNGEKLDWNPREKFSPLFLEHLITTNWFRIAVVQSAQRHGFVVDEWLDDRTLKRQHTTESVTLTGPAGGTQRVTIIPDTYFVLNTPNAIYHHFLEIDLGTVTGAATSWSTRSWQRKVAAYLEYYRCGKYQARYKTQGLRILTVTTGQKRLDNLKAITEKTGGRGRFWFSTLEQVSGCDVLTDPIWKVATKEGPYSLTW